MYKICFVTTVSLTLKSFVLELAKYLHSTNEFEIHFVCDYDAEFEKMIPEYIHYHPVSMKRGISFDGLKAIREMKRYFKQEKFDLVQYSTPNAACYASIAAKAARIPCRLYCQWGIAYVGFSGIKRFVFKQMEKMICRNSTRIEPDSFGNLKFSRSEKLYDESKSCVIWNGSASGVNLVKFNADFKKEWHEEIRRKYDIPEDAFVYIFIGRITRDKGINELFAASKELFARCPDAYLLLVGNVEKSELINPDLLKWTNEEKRVIYCGYTNQVERYLAAGDVYVLPSYREGFGSAVVEAEAMGLPVIITNIPGPTDAMKKNETGLVVEKANSADLCNAMETLYRSPELCIEYGKNALAFAGECFDQAILFDKIREDRVDMITGSSSKRM